MSVRAQIVLTALLTGLAATGYLLLPGQNLTAFLAGGVAGLVAAFGMLPGMPGAGWQVVLGVVAGLALFAFLLIHMTDSELAYLDLGVVGDRVRSAAHAVSGLFAGVALRVALSAFPAGR